MGRTITVAAPGAARMALAQPTLDEIQAMSFDEQTKVMCDLAGKINSPISARYAYWSVNVKLCFWYELGEFMRQGKVAPIPQGYRLSANANSVLEAVKKLSRANRSLCCATSWLTWATTPMWTTARWSPSRSGPDTG